MITNLTDETLAKQLEWFSEALKEKPTKTRTCANPECNADISHLSKLTRFCRPCVYQRRREAANESARRLRSSQRTAAATRIMVEPKTTESRVYCQHYLRSTNRTSFEDDDGTKHFVCVPCWLKLLED